MPMLKQGKSRRPQMHNHDASSYQFVSSVWKSPEHFAFLVSAGRQHFVVDDKGVNYHGVIAKNVNFPFDARRVSNGARL